MIINPISKGGNRLTPEIIVTAPSGSTLDLMQGSVVLQTYTLGSAETQHTFTVKNTGTYTIRGTNGSDTASVDVVIDSIGQYNCVIQYRLWLYNNGDECEEVTGGWTQTNGSNPQTFSTFSTNYNGGYLYGFTSKYYCSFAHTRNKIPLKAGDTLVLVNITAQFGGWFEVDAVPDYPGTQENPTGKVILYSKSSSESKTVMSDSLSMPITVSGDYYIRVGIWRADDASSYLMFNGLYLY